MSNTRYYSGWGGEIPHLVKGEIGDLRRDIEGAFRKVADEHKVALDLNFEGDTYAADGEAMVGGLKSNLGIAPIDLDVETVNANVLAQTAADSGTLVLKLMKIAFENDAVVGAPVELTDATARITIEDGMNTNVAKGESGWAFSETATIEAGDFLYLEVVSNAGSANGVFAALVGYPALP